MRLYSAVKIFLLLFLNLACHDRDDGLFVNYNKAEFCKGLPSPNIGNHFKEITDPVYAEINTHGFCTKMYVIAGKNDSVYGIHIIPYDNMAESGIYKSGINRAGFFEDSINISTNNDNEDRVKMNLLFDVANNALYYRWIDSNEKDNIFPGGYPALIKSKVQINKAAPQFSLIDYVGNRFDLSKCKNKFVLINFWSVSCNQYDLQFLYKLRQEFSSEELTIIGITDDDKIKMDQFNETNKLNYPVTVGSSDIFDLYEVKKIPSYCLIDKNGTVIKKRFHIEKLSEEIKDLIVNN